MVGDGAIASHATTRPGIPLNTNAMLKTRMPAGLALIGELKQKGYPLAYVGDVVGTGSPQPRGMAAGSNRNGAVKNKE